MTLRPVTLIAAACALPLLLAAPSALAQEAADLEGVWRGTLDVQVSELRLELHVEEDDGELSSFLVSVDQGGSRIPVDSTQWDGETLTVDMPGIRARYEASLDGPDRLDGVFT